MSEPRRPRTRAELDAIASGVDDGTSLARFVSALRRVDSLAPTPASQELLGLLSFPPRPSGSAPNAAGQRSFQRKLVPTKSGLVASAATAAVIAAGLVTALFGSGADEVAVTADQAPAPPPVTSRDRGSSTTSRPPSTTTKPGVSTSIPSTDTTRWHEAARLITVADAGSIRVGVIGDDVVLDSLSPADGWIVIDNSEGSNAVDVTFRRGGEVVEVAVVPDNETWLVSILDRRTGDEHVSLLDDYGPPTTGSG